MLRALSGCYGLGVDARNRLYDLGLRRVYTVDRPVISVGNLTVGGSGKTPLVLHLCEQLRRAGRRVAVLARGYGARPGEVNDEMLLISRRDKDVICIAHPDRVAAARMALEQYEPDVLLLDDGFQHRRIARDLDIVLLDAQNPFGHGFVLPRGLLRESPASLRRANLIVLTHADRLDAPERSALVERINKQVGDVDIVTCRHAPTGLVTLDGKSAPDAPPTSAKVVCLSSIARPISFERTVRDMGYAPVAQCAWPDHHPYTSENIAEITAWARSCGAEAILTTEKDAVKLDALDAPSDACPIFAVRIAIDFLANDGTILDAHVDACLERASAEGSSDEP
jgi:tetraacyldisaccharide 4'-kinase